MRTTFPPIVGLFEIFDRNFTNLVAPPSDNNMNYVVHLKEKSFLQKKLQTSLKSAYKRQRKNLFELCTPRTNIAPAFERDGQKA